MKRLDRTSTGRSEDEEEEEEVEIGWFDMECESVMRSDWDGSMLSSEDSMDSTTSMELCKEMLVDSCRVRGGGDGKHEHKDPVFDDDDDGDDMGEKRCLSVEGRQFDPQELESPALDTVSSGVVVVQAGERYRELLSREDRYIPVADYLTNVQKEVTSQHRESVVSWIIDLCDSRKYTHHTAALAVNTLDRFLSKREISIKALPAVTAACFRIAAKLNEQESDLPSLKFIAWSAKEDVARVRSAEAMVLSELRWDVSAVTAHLLLPFLVESKYAFVKQSSPQHNAEEYAKLTKLFLEIAMLDANFVGFSPSVIAHAALCVLNTMTSASSELLPQNLPMDARNRQAVGHVARMMAVSFKGIFAE
mmetsp:Transcript_14796/g.31727  ORF Transcript_14796/g.31727 Transcript_14796/m.31727 type:complete len:363 (-) Transcript_14796:67-1155(-)